MKLTAIRNDGTKITQGHIIRVNGFHNGYLEFLLSDGSIFGLNLSLIRYFEITN